ncbi:MAG: hypothetical protein HC902_00430 [Calothrix sp. SM1_5_4]|nr:hypothetical protein [Calothrix sp. SM1_5_4]
MSRTFECRSALARVLDPIADKALFICVALTFYLNEKVSLLQIGLLGARDFFVIACVLWLWLTGQRRPSDTLEPNVFGKLTTVAQYLAFISCFFARTIDRDLVGIAFVFGILAAALYLAEFTGSANKHAAS